MPALTSIPSRLLPLAEDVLDNQYGRESLREGGEQLRAAYKRSQKRRVKPSRDRKLRRQLEAAVAALDEGTAALASGRGKPRHTGRNVALGIVLLAAAGGAVAYWYTSRKGSVGQETFAVDDGGGT